MMDWRVARLIIDHVPDHEPGITPIGWKEETRREFQRADRDKKTTPNVLGILTKAARECIQKILRLL